jgi:D-glycerate 3-kinase
MSLENNTQRLSQALINKMQLPANFHEIIESIYLPLTTHILDKKSNNPLLVSINGAQGTGKSTLTHFLKHLIEAESNFSVVEISLDDFYSTRAERKQLANLVHPLLQTRGVPGTHDIQLMENTLARLLEGDACVLPRFNKAVDDRHHEEQWTSCNKNTDIILFEGWCNHSPAQSVEELMDPVNELEAKEDVEGVWRHYANEQLKDYHDKIFNHADMSIMLKAPNFEKIYEWRSLQEKKLKQNTKDSEQPHIMSAAKLKRFVQHYERITRHTLQQLPTTADIVIPIAADHSIETFIQRS